LNLYFLTLIITNAVICHHQLNDYSTELLHDLQHSDRFIIVPADKNLGPVIMERDTYINAVLSLLQDKNNYKQLTSIQAKLDMQLLQEMLNKWLEKYSSTIDKRDLDYLNRSIDTDYVKDPFSHFYIITKLHKNPWKPRPIVSYCGSYLHGLGKWLDQQLQSIANKMPSYISSSFDLVDIMKKI
jgi:menaquinone-dependent protoporphyrinogen IX oxidase